MSDELMVLQIERQRESWFSSWCRWCPTSLHLLREAEKFILSNLKSSYKGRYVDVETEEGSGKNSNKEENKNYLWTISVNEQSENDPIVLLHGFGSAVGLWCLNIDSLAQNRPLYAFDLPGFGRSSRTPMTSDAIEVEKQFVSTIESWRKKLNLNKFIILGHSFGGFLAASYAIKYPERVSHLILADPWGFPERPLDINDRYNIPIWIRALGAILQPFNPLFMVRTAGPLGPKLVQKARPDIWMKFSGLIKDSEESIPDYLYHCNAQNPTGEAAFHSLMSGFGWAKYPMIQRMDALHKDVPITLIYGARSWVDRDPGFQIKYMRQKSFVDVKIIQGAGHHVYADRASEFNRIVNTVGEYVDRGQLPPLNETPQREQEGEGEGGNGWAQFTNCRNDRIRDDPDMVD